MDCCGDNPKITFAADVTTIYFQAFEYCRVLREVLLGPSIVTIANQAFAYSYITSLIISDSLISIGEEAFIECKRLRDVTLL
jgi:predicted Kef-type K+ transport protein